MKSSTTYLNWFRRMVILGAVVGVGVFASTAGAVGRPPDVQDVAASLSSDVNRPPDIQDLATRMSASTSDVFERYAAAHPYGAGLSVSEATRPPDIQHVATRMSASTADVFERYAAAHPYGTGLSLSNTVVSRPPDVQDSAQALQNSSSGGQSNGFISSAWGIGISTGVGLALLLGIVFLMSRQLRHRVQPA